MRPWYWVDQNWNLPTSEASVTVAATYLLWAGGLRPDNDRGAKGRLTSSFMELCIEILTDISTPMLEKVGTSTLENSQGLRPDPLWGEGMGETSSWFTSRETRPLFPRF